MRASSCAYHPSLSEYTNLLNCNIHYTEEEVGGFLAHLILSLSDFFPNVPKVFAKPIYLEHICSSTDCSNAVQRGNAPILVLFNMLQYIFISLRSSPHMFPSCQFCYLHHN